MILRELYVFRKFETTLISHLYKKFDSVGDLNNESVIGFWFSEDEKKEFLIAIDYVKKLFNIHDPPRKSINLFTDEDIININKILEFYAIDSKLFTTDLGPKLPNKNY